MTDQAPGEQTQTPAAGEQQANPQGQQSGQPAQPQPGQQQEGQQPQQGQQPGEQQPKQIMVTEDVLTKMRDQIKTSHTKVDEMSQQLQQANDQLALYQARSQMAPQPGQPAQPQPGQQQNQMQPPAGQQQGFQDPFRGMADVDVPTVGDMKGVLSQMVQMVSAANSNPQVDSLVQTVQNLQLQIVDPNYQQTIQKYLPAMVNNDPIAQNMIRNSENPILAALTMARKNPQYQADMQGPAQGQQPAQSNGNAADQANQQQQPPDLLSQLDQLLTNQGKPASPSAVSGAGAISAADKFSAMDDAAFDAHVRAVKEKGMGP